MFDYKEGEIMSIRVIYHNHGNTKISPQFALKIKKIDTEETVLNVIYPYPENEPAVGPFNSYEIPAIEGSTNGFEDGKYLAEIEMSVNGNIVEDNFKFNIGGHFTAGGLLGAISVIGGGNLLLAWLIIGVALVALAVFLGLFRGKKLAFIKAGISRIRSIF